MRGFGGHKHTEETKKKMSESQKGKKHNYTKKRKKNRPGSKTTSGFVWYNNGEIEVLVRPGTLLEGDNWVKGRLYRLEEAREASVASEKHYRNYDLISYRWRR